MKRFVHFLPLLIFILSGCAAGISPNQSSQSQAPTPDVDELASVATRPPGALLGTAKSIWGSFPFHPAATDTATPALSGLPCTSLEEICVFRHHFSFHRPFSSSFNTAVEHSYRYGSTQFGERAPHHGVEILNPTGTPVLAAAEGTVVVAGNDANTDFGPAENFYGNLVVLVHQIPGIREPVFTLYGHLSAVTVQIGQRVASGAPLGKVGASGRALGSHLHFEVRVGENTYAHTRNPELWLIPENDKSGQPYGALAGKISNSQGEPIYLTFKLDYYPDGAELPETTYRIETYAPETVPTRGDNRLQENFALSDLPPGRYRITLSISREWTERWVQVQPGNLSFIRIQAQ